MISLLRFRDWWQIIRFLHNGYLPDNCTTQHR